MALAISERKTGGLMGLAAELGALAAGADAALVGAARAFGVALGELLPLDARLHQPSAAGSGSA